MRPSHEEKMPTGKAVKAEIRNTRDVLAMIRPRIALLAGENSLQALEAFLSGFDVACKMYGIRFEEREPDLAEFREWLGKKYMKESTAMGWRGIIVDDVGEDGKRAVERFYELMDEFLGGLQQK